MLGGGPRGDALLQLIRAAGPDTRKAALEHRALCDFVSEVVAILRSPVNPFDGMLEAPSPIVRLYQAHKISMRELRPHRDEALQALLRDALAALYDGAGPIARSAIDALGVSEPARHNTGTTIDPDNG